MGLQTLPTKMADNLDQETVIKYVLQTKSFAISSYSILQQRRISANKSLIDDVKSNVFVYFIKLLFSLPCQRFLSVISKLQIKFKEIDVKIPIKGLSLLPSDMPKLRNAGKAVQR
jgi:hypothetical protein